MEARRVERADGWRRATVDRRRQPARMEAEDRRRARWPRPETMIQHIVLFTPKAGIGRDDLRAFARSIEQCARQIDAIQRVRIGRSTSIDAGYPRALAHDVYDFAGVFEFADPDALVTYLRHPLHAELGRLFWLYCDRTLILETHAVDPRSSALDTIAGDERSD